MHTETTEANRPNIVEALTEQHPDKIVIRPGQAPRPEDFAEIQQAIRESKEGKEKRQEYRARLKKFATRLFDFDAKIEDPLPVWSINGIKVSTAGNLTTVSAQSKTGKSALMDAFMAAVLLSSGFQDAAPRRGTGKGRGNRHRDR